MRGLPYIIIGVLLMCMASCRSVRETEGHSSVQYVDRWHTDSVWVHDVDSVFVKEETRHDTVTLTVERWKVRERIRTVHDTLTVILTDTVLREKVVEREPGIWQRAQTGMGRMLIVLVLAGLLWLAIKRRKI